MEIFATENPKVFLDYAISDVLSLSLVPNAMCQNINTLLMQCYRFIGIGDQLFRPHDLPMTVGSIVSAIFENYIKSEFPKDFSNISNGMAIPIKVLTKKSDSKEKNSRKNSKSGKLNKQYYSSLIDAGGSRSLALGYSRSTGILNTLVTGGRCNNEQPFEFEKEYVFDFDLSSCYGTALTQFSFPIGLPTIYARTAEDPRINLIDFLKTYESELVENLYTITVSGKLSFEQDLVYSKLVDEKKLSEKILNLISDNKEDEIDIIDEGVSKVVLLRKEIVYGVITSDILNALRKICSSLEWSEIGQLEVETAIYYSKKNFVTDKVVFLEELKKNPGNYTYSIEKQAVLDERNRSWTSIELNQFIGPPFCVFRGGAGN